MSAVELTGAEAVRPGYGFLSENFNFAKILEESNIKFIGPKSKIIKSRSKIQAKKVAKENGLPVIEGSDGRCQHWRSKRICRNIGFPVLIKAFGGGGGKGMKIVLDESNSKIVSRSKIGSKKFFANDEVYIEKFFQDPRHIEVQILSGKNRTVHLHERIAQYKKHQKLIEETPSQF